MFDPPSKPTDQTAPEPALVIDRLTVSYGARVVLRDVTMQLRHGEVTVLVGPNGSGKSTLLRSFVGLHPSRGGLRLLPLTNGRDGGDVRRLPRATIARRMTMLTQSRPVPDGITVHAAVSFGRYPHQRRRHARDHDGERHIASAMEVTGIADLAERRVDQLSGGQLQRVWLASCLAQNTDILLLDEPTNNLDLRFQAQMLDLIVQLARSGIAVCVVLHDLNHAAEVADEVVLVAEHQMLAAGPVDEVLTHDLLSRAYEIPIRIGTDALGQMMIRPDRHAAKSLVLSASRPEP